MACGIYKITNQINGKSYIGQAIDIQTRWNKEKTRAFDPNSLEYEKTLSQAFRKYGLNNFTFEIIEQCEKALLNEKEIYNDIYTFSTSCIRCLRCGVSEGKHL